MKLEGLLKSKKMKIEALGGAEHTVYELPFGAQMKVIKSAFDEDGMEGAITLKYGLQLEQSVEEVAAQATMALVQEITEKVSELMDIKDEDVVKN
jgi:hypothetical protein